MGTITFEIVNIQESTPRNNTEIKKLLITQCLGMKLSLGAFLKRTSDLKQIAVT